MATEILVNDGGAPARILPFKAGEALTAGDALGITHVASGDVTVNQLEQSDTSATFIGVALTDCASGEMASVITGRGVIVRINCADVNGGVMLMPHASTGGQLIAYSQGTDAKGFDSTPCAITLEDVAAGALVKVLLF